MAERTTLLHLIEKLDDEAFAWLAMTLVSGVWPAGLGGFEDRVTIEAIRDAATAYVRQ